MGFFRTKLKGSLSLEASFVVPFMMFFLMTILMSTEMVRLQSNLLEGLHQGMGIAYEDADNLKVERTFYEAINKKEYPYLVVKKNEAGLSFSDESTISENGLIELKVSCQIKPFIPWIPIGRTGFSDRIIAHSFTGYSEDILGNIPKEDDEYVFVTKTGEKYHRSSDCSYLKVNPKSVGMTNIEELRNSSGGKYYPCERCFKKGSGRVFITQDGSSYHSESDCASLKRTVEIVLLKEAIENGYSPCSKCG